MLTARGRSWRLLLGVCGLIGSLVALPTPATATIEVTSLADPGTGGCKASACTLREAIAAAPAGETITFAPALFAQGPGTILLTSGELLLDKALTIQGPGPGQLRIDGNQASRVFHIGPGAVVTLTGMTIQRGRCTDSDFELCEGGGIWNDRGTLTLSHSTLRDNHAQMGGGLSNRHDSITVTVTQSTMRDNHVSYLGGGLFNFRGMAMVTQSTVRDNHASNGGAGSTTKAP